MRFILMQLFNWSPTTFHSVWNAGNCQMYVLKKDLTKPGPSPYVLDKMRGDVPQSSINVRVELLLRKNNQLEEESSGETTTTATTKTVKNLTLHNYLSVPPPRSTHFCCIKHMLAQQYPDEINDANDIVSITIMPFVAGGGGIVTGRCKSRCGVEAACNACNKNTSSSSSPSTLAATASPPPSLVVSSSTVSSTVSSSSLLSVIDETTASSKMTAAKREQSLRWSYFRIPTERLPNNSDA
jgi:hypothetical protein